MNILSLIFDKNRTFLGEVATRHGGLERILLNTHGETHIGPYASDWQLRGIPVVRSVMGAEQGKADVFFQERIPVRTHEFWNALEHWCGQHGMVLIQVPEGSVQSWEGLLHLPLEDAERFSIMLALRSDENREEWGSVIQDTVHAIQRNDAAGKRKLTELKKKAAGGIMKKMATA